MTSAGGALLTIGFDATRALGNSTGLGNYARQLISGIAEVAPERTLLLYSPKPPAGHLRDWAGAAPGQICFGNSVAALPGIRAAWRTFRLGHRVAADGVQLYHGLSHELPRDLAGSGIRSVVSVPDLLYITRPELFNLVDRNSYLWRYRWSARNADAVVAISSGTATDLVSYFGIPPDRIAVVPPAIDPAFLIRPDTETIQATRERFRLPGEYLVAVGTLEPRKNQGLAIEALAQLGPAAPMLLLVGRDGGSAQELIKLAHRCGVGDRVRLLTEVGPGQLPALVAGGMVASYLSTSEGFGLPIVEAMALGVPVVAARGGNLEDAGGSVARYVDPHDPTALSTIWQELLDDEQLRGRLGAEGMRHATKFDRRVLANRLLNIYDAVWQEDPLPDPWTAA